MESKCPDKTLHMRGMNLNLSILHMFRDTFSFGMGHILIAGGVNAIYSLPDLLPDAVGQVKSFKILTPIQVKFQTRVKKFQR